MVRQHYGKVMAKAKAEMRWCHATCVNWRRCAGATVDFHEAALNHIGWPQLPPEGSRTGEEREQLGEIAEQLCYA